MSTLFVGLLWALSVFLYSSKITCVLMFLVYFTFNISEILLQPLIALSFYGVKLRPCVIPPREQQENTWHCLRVQRRTVQGKKIKSVQPGLHCQETWSQNVPPPRLPLGFISEGVNCGTPTHTQKTTTAL